MLSKVEGEVRQTSALRLILNNSSEVFRREDLEEIVFNAEKLLQV